jgi:hypothetical protein
MANNELVPAEDIAAGEQALELMVAYGAAFGEQEPRLFAQFQAGRQESREAQRRLGAEFAANVTKVNDRFDVQFVFNEHETAEDFERSRPFYEGASFIFTEGSEETFGLDSPGRAEAYSVTEETAQGLAAEYGAPEFKEAQLGWLAQHGTKMEPADLPPDTIARYVRYKRVGSAEGAQDANLLASLDNQDRFEEALLNNAQSLNMYSKDIQDRREWAALHKLVDTLGSAPEAEDADDAGRPKAVLEFGAAHAAGMQAKASSIGLAFSAHDLAPGEQIDNKPFTDENAQQLVSSVGALCLNRLARDELRRSPELWQDQDSSEELAASLRETKTEIHQLVGGLDYTQLSETWLAAVQEPYQRYGDAVLQAAWEHGLDASAGQIAYDDLLMLLQGEE